MNSVSVGMDAMHRSYQPLGANIEEYPIAHIMYCHVATLSARYRHRDYFNFYFSTQLCTVCFTTSCHSAISSISQSRHLDICIVRIFPVEMPPARSTPLNLLPTDILGRRTLPEREVTPWRGSSIQSTKNVPGTHIEPNGI